MIRLVNEIHAEIDSAAQDLFGILPIPWWAPDSHPR